MRIFAPLIITVLAGAAVMACGTGSAPDPAPTLPSLPAAAPTVAPAAQAAPAEAPTDAPAPQVAAPAAEATKPVLPTDPPARATGAPASATPTEAPTQVPAPTATKGPPPPPFNTVALPLLPTATPEALTTETDVPAAPIGTQVGEIPPAFAMERSDGSPVTSADLASAGRPVLMMYFATW